MIFRFSPDFLWNCGPGWLFRQQFGHFGGHLQQTNEKHDQFTDLELGGCGCAFYCFLRPFYGHFLRFATLLAIWRTLVSLIAYFRSFYVIFGVYDIASSFSQLFIFILIIIHQVYHNTCPIHLKKLCNVCKGHCTLGLNHNFSDMGLELGTSRLVLDPVSQRSRVRIPPRATFFFMSEKWLIFPSVQCMSYKETQSGSQMLGNLS